LGVIAVFAGELARRGYEETWIVEHATIRLEPSEIG
jgi:hypothetical protein